MTHWTEADQAELDVFLWGFTGRFWAHRDTCEVCRAGLGWCEETRKDFDQLLEWKSARSLLTRAESLRQEEMA